MRQQNIGKTVADQAQPLQDEEADNPDCTEVLNVLEVRNIPSKADDEILRLYFESAKSGGCDDGVEECSISHGTAYIKFHSPEGKLCNICIAASLMLILKIENSRSYRQGFKGHIHLPSHKSLFAFNIIGESSFCLKVFVPQRL